MKLSSVIICIGFVQSYGLKNGDNVREEFVKPIMFSGGIGYMPHSMIKKNKPEKGKLITELLNNKVPSVH